MRAIVLSAGQGKRLLPLTASEPKCLLPIDGESTVLDLQLEALARCGFELATVVIGFGAEHVERFIEARNRTGTFGKMRVEALYNPFFSVSDNLATCWMVRDEMQGDFVLLNGDTVFEDALLQKVLAAPPAPISVTIDRKDEYDADDMKVKLDPQGRLGSIGKTLPLHTVDGEAIGMILFRSSGATAYCEALERAIRQPESMRNWYLAVVDEMAHKMPIETICIEGCWWAEIDCREDLDAVRGHFLPESVARTVREP
jgi:choline kinase